MQSLISLTIVSFKMFIRSRQALFFTLFMPLVIMFIFGMVGFDKPPTFDVGLASGNPEPATLQMIDKIREFSIFKITEGSLEDELKELRDGNRAVVLNIPDNFVSAPTAGPKTLTVYINESQPSQAQTVVSVLNQYLDKTTLAMVKAPVFFNLKQEIIDSRQLNYIDYLLPGLIAMGVMQMSVFSVGFVFVQYKEKGVLKRLLATPMRPVEFVTANILTRLLISVVQAGIFIVVGVLLMDATVVGSYWLVLLCVILGALMFLGLGFTISGLAKTVDSVPAIANLIVFPMLFLGGTFFPISGMPDWLQKGAKLLPLTFFSDAIRAVMTKDAGLGAIKTDVAGMLIWSVVLISVAIFTFNIQEKDSA